MGVWCVGAPLQPGLHWGPLEEEAVLEKGEGTKTSHEEDFSLAPCGAICSWKQSSSWTSEKLHLQVSQTVLPGVELLLRPQPPQKSLNVLHPKLEEVAAVMVAEEESAPREEAAFPQEDSAESCTDPGHESPQSIQGDNKLVSESVAQTEDQPFKGSQDDSMDKPCLPQTAPEP